MTISLKFSVEGDPAKVFVAKFEAKAPALTEAVNAAASAMRDDLRAQVVGAGLGDGLARAWSVKPAQGYNRFRALVGPGKSAALIESAFFAGATIVARNARWMVVPLPEAIARGYNSGVLRNNDARSLRKKWANVAAAIRDFGDLRFVPVGGGRTALLFGHVKGRRGTARDVPLFLLVRQVQEKKLLDIDGARARARADLARRIAAALKG